MLHPEFDRERANDEIWYVPETEIEDGAAYAGEMNKAGQMHGLGVKRCKDGTVYEGTFYEGKLFGIVKSSYPHSRYTYFGEYKDGVRFGKHSFYLEGNLHYNVLYGPDNKIECRDHKDQANHAFYFNNSQPNKALAVNWADYF